jgi:hypothetical protein
VLITIPWHSNLTLSILNIYAPNAHHENQQFWETLEEKWTNLRLPHPDIMLGDFNLVEDAIDRLPSHTDPAGPVSALSIFRTSHQLCDGWRATHPTRKYFSFLQKSTGVQSRIDRIYTSNEILKSAIDWEIEYTAVMTDHKMISTCVIDPKMPFIGHGRWTMPLFLLKDKTLKKGIHDLVLQFQRDLNNMTERSEESNPQTLFQSFKDHIISLTKNRAKVCIPKMENKIKSLKHGLAILLANPNLENEDKLAELAMFEE